MVFVCATHGKDFAMCKREFAVCLGHTANVPNHIVRDSRF